MNAPNILQISQATDANLSRLVVLLEADVPEPNTREAEKTKGDGEQDLH